MSMLASVAVEAVVPMMPLAAEHEFEALDACHREVLATLRDLARLIEHLDDQGVDPVARRMASDVVRFFGQTARAHHADEERLVFPGLLASDDAALVQHTRRLQQDHGWLEEDWLELSAQLDAVAQGYSWYDIDALRQGVVIFTELYKDHIDLEESLIYPEARRLLAERPEAGQARERRAQR
ncbi:hemerythrin domain-containing protein [Sphaerotilus uruguayifluvii]|uniref:Hemerythrin-like domain-containing protein n=1 Tax=Sphaerotilus uruguayifluvii TaxID=2735897 RepID=A0ABX2G4F1_9BURK|nr:hemerythrin domain-containing protein [Leptothrix sp. C29]NRT56255.1 hemerythrin-like domain-containing protein [Leptothrix sp. C29]